MAEKSEYPNLKKVTVEVAEDIKLSVGDNITRIRGGIEYFGTKFNKGGISVIDIPGLGAFSEENLQKKGVIISYPV